MVVYLLAFAVEGPFHQVVVEAAFGLEDAYLELQVFVEDLEGEYLLQACHFVVQAVGIHSLQELKRT